MYAINPDTIGKIDKRTVDYFKIPSILLMENAGLAVSNFLLSNYNFIKVLVLSGPGNNGGDSFVVARHLFNKNYNVKVCILGNENKYKKDALTNLKILKQLKVPVYSKRYFQKLISSVDDKTIIIDGIFGTGFKGEIRKEYINVFKKLKHVDNNIISIDIPSGMNGETGEIAKYTINAHSTITFQVVKTGMLWHEALNYTGELIVADISIPNEVIRYFNPYYVIDEDIIKSLIISNQNIKKKSVHKTSKGKLGIIGGADGMQGAPQLAGMAALKTASGIVYVNLLKDTERKFYPELVFNDNYLEIIQKNDNIVIGPGMGQDEKAKNVLIKVLKEKNKNIVIDADAINMLSQMPESIRKKIIQGTIITPHPEEFKRISGEKFDNIAEKIKIAESFAKENNVLLILKSPPTIITNGEMTFIFPSMSSKLATAGSGDVLTGIIGGLLSSGYTPFTASIIAVYVHFKAGAFNDGHSISANDIINNISKIMESLL